jgi:hypothetical protein
MDYGNNLSNKLGARCKTYNGYVVHEPFDRRFLVNHITSQGFQS